MFTFLSRFRRQTAVLTALALVASVLVAVPVSAADPEADYTATFSACVGDAAESAGFTDVPAGHANAGDIDCIAYYGVTKGTSASTYSPLMSVTREHMALFLVRLAGLVEIDVPPAGDSGFSDVGDLSDESQAAISQLAQLEITKGTSDTTYSPADSVTRGHMALFISRLMDKMSPMSDGDDSDGDHGYTPSDVDDNDRDKEIGSPFGDLDSVTKATYDAITNLWELGVASGISDTAYGPSASITRASMAGFMAGVLGHSNARPAGLTIQASTTSDFGTIDDAAVVVSVRDDSFAPVVDQAVDIFSSEADNMGLVKGGTCDTTQDAVEGDCVWNDNDEFTDEDGNIVDDTAGATEGDTNVYYAWIGTEDGETFDSDETGYVSLSISAMTEEASIKVTTSINENAQENRVHLDNTSSVTFTVQLVDDADGAGDPVARSGIEITVGIVRTGYTNTSAATLTTDENGKAEYTLDGPEDDEDEDAQSRTDTVTFTYKGKAAITEAADLEEEEIILWIEAPSATYKAEASAPGYVIKETDGDAKVSASVTLYDQYGNSYREAKGQMVGINFTGESDKTANVDRNGVARRSATLEDQSEGTPITISYAADPNEEPNNVDISAVTEVGGPTSIQVVVRADEDGIGLKNVHTLYADDNEFTAQGSGADAALLYSYDEDDTFTDGGQVITMEKFEELLANPDSGTNAAEVDVVIYATNGRSIFQVTTPSSG